MNSSENTILLNPTKMFDANNFDESFFKDKKVLVFDDILTQGTSYARFSCTLENMGAEVLGGYFLGRTLMI